MNIYEWNRKDEKPEKTISLIKDKLDSVNLHTKIVDQKSYGDYWSSARIEFEDLSGWGANGKGINIDYTMASAYGELMERLQAGVLLEPLFPSKKIKSIQPSNKNKSIEIIRKFFRKETEKYSDTQLMEMLSEYEEMNSTSLFLDVESGKEVEITDRFLGFICGTNGIAAGNTLEEAFCQGLCEIFERYVMKMIYQKNTPYNWPTINRSLYKNTKSMMFINEIEKKGYTCVIKDCSLNGLLPVVGVLILDSSKTKYVFRLGSDINFDIALQRCITEIFQGINFDITFRMQMQSIFACNDNASVWNFSNPTEGVTRSITNGMGILPFHMFNDYETNSIEPFQKHPMTNKESVKRLVQILKKMNKKIYIRDCSYLGFPTIHIFIPGISNAYFYENNMDYLPVLKSIGKLHKLWSCNTNVASQELLELLLTISNYSTFKYNTTLNKFTGITLKNNYNKNIINLDYVIGMLALEAKDFKLAKEHLVIAYKYDSIIRNTTYDYVSLIINGMECGYPYDHILKLLKNISAPMEILELCETFYNSKENGYKISSCSNCETCSVKNECSFIQWSEIINLLEEKKQIFYSSFNYKSAFYNSLRKEINCES